MFRTLIPSESFCVSTAICAIILFLFLSSNIFDHCLIMIIEYGVRCVRASGIMVTESYFVGMDGTESTLS
jgi:hypothetical protein